MTQNDQLISFYNHILNEINSLIKKKLFQKALDRINEELNCTYIPAKFEQQLKDLTKEVRIKQYEHCAKQIAALPVNKLIWHICNNLTENYDTFIFLIDKYQNKITPQQWDQLLAIFSSETMENQLKILFLFPLLDVNNVQQKTFSYYNKSTKKTTEMILSTQMFAQHDDFTNISLQWLAKHFIKEPSKLKLAEHLIELLTVYFFPDLIPYEKNKLGNEIAKYIEWSFNEQLPINKIDSKALTLINLALQSPN